MNNARITTAWNKPYEAPVRPVLKVHDVDIVSDDDAVVFSLGDAIEKRDSNGWIVAAIRELDDALRNQNLALELVKVGRRR